MICRLNACALHALIAASRFCDKDLSGEIRSGAACVKKPQETKRGCRHTLNQSFAILWPVVIASNCLRLTEKPKSIAARNAGFCKQEDGLAVVRKQSLPQRV